MVRADEDAAAVLEEFGAPLGGAGGRPGRARRRRGARPARGLRRLPHRHVHGLGRRPVGLRARGARPRGRAASSSASARACSRRATATTSSRCSPPSAASASTAEPAHEPVPGHPRAAEPGLPARRHAAAVPRRRADPPLHGHEHLRGVHGDAGDRAGQGLAGGAAGPRAPVRLRPVTGLGAAMFTAKVEAGSTVVVYGAGMVGLGAVAGSRLQGAERIICVDLSEERLALARGQGATDTWVGGVGRHRRSACSTRPAGSARTSPSRRPATSASCARPWSRPAWAGGCARSPAWRARGRRSTSSRAT